MPTNENLDQLSFGIGHRSHNRNVGIGVMFLFSGAAIVLTALLVLELTSPGPTGMSWGYVIGLVVAIAMAIGLAFVASQIKSFSVRDGRMTLPLPLRLKSGALVGSISIREITGAKRWASPAGRSGIEFQLRDGTEFQILFEDLPEGAETFLSRLLAAVSGKNLHDSSEFGN